MAAAIENSSRCECYYEGFVKGLVGSGGTQIGSNNYEDYSEGLAKGIAKKCVAAAKGTSYRC